MLLAGFRWDRLSMRDRIDVVEAIMVEPIGIDEQLDALAARIADHIPNEESWVRAAQQTQAKAEAMHPEAGGLTDEQRAERERRKAERDARRVADSPA